MGAFIGALVSYVVAEQTARKAADAARITQTEAEKAATMKLVVKLMQLSNAISGLHHGIEKGIAKATNELGLGDVETWRVMQPFGGVIPTITVDPDDLTALLRAKAYSYLSNVIFAFDAFNAFSVAMTHYGPMREDVYSRLTPQGNEGLVVDLGARGDQIAGLMPRIAALDAYAKEVRDEARKVYEVVRTVVEEFGPIARGYFNDPTFPIPGFRPEPVDEPKAA